MNVSGCLSNCQPAISVRSPESGPGDVNANATHSPHQATSHGKCFHLNPTKCCGQDNRPCTSPQLVSIAGVCHSLLDLRVCAEKAAAGVECHVLEYPPTSGASIKRRYMPGWHWCVNLHMCACMRRLTTHEMPCVR